MELSNDTENVMSLINEQISLLTTFYDETNSFVNQNFKEDVFQNLDDYIKLIELRKGYVDRLNEIKGEIENLNYDKDNNVIAKLKEDANSIFTSISRIEESLNNKVATIKAEMEKGFKKLNQSIAYNEIAFDGIPMTGNLFNHAK